MNWLLQAKETWPPAPASPGLLPFLGSCVSWALHLGQVGGVLLPSLPAGSWGGSLGISGVVFLSTVAKAQASGSNRADVSHSPWTPMSWVVSASTHG